MNLSIAIVALITCRFWRRNPYPRLIVCRIAMIAAAGAVIASPTLRPALASFESQREFLPFAGRAIVKVVTPDGTPVAGVRIGMFSLVHLMYSHQIQPAVTDSSGHYSLRIPPASK